MIEIYKNLRPLQGFRLGDYPLRFDVDQDTTYLPSLGTTLVVSDGGVLLTQQQLVRGLASRLRFPNNLPKGEDTRPQSRAALSREVDEFIKAIRKGLIPDEILPWRNARKFISDVEIYRINGLPSGARLVVRGDRNGKVVTTESTTDPIPVSLQFYQYEDLYPRAKT